MSLIPAIIKQLFGKAEVRGIVFFAFYVALGLYSCLTILEIIRPQLVSLYFSIDIFFWPCFILGLLTACLPVAPREDSKKKTNNERHFFWMICVIIGMMTFAFHSKPTFLGSHFVISLFISVLIIGILFLERNQER